MRKALGSGYRVLACYGHVRELSSKAGSVRSDQDFAMVYAETGKRDALGAKPVRRVVFHEVTPEATGRRRRNGGPGSSPNQAFIGKGLLRSKLCAPILDGHRLTL